MKRYFFIIIMVSVNINLRAQDSANSNAVDNYFYADLLKGIRTNPNNYLYAPIADYTASSLFYNYASGELKQGAEPEGIHEFGLSSTGIYHNKKGITFFGNLSIQKSYYDNLKWNLSYQLPDEGVMPDPHYFGVSKGAKWSNQEYNLQGGLFIPILTDRLHFLLNIEYGLANKYRTDLDPRPEITYNDLGVTGGANYKISEQHSLKIAGEYGFTHVQNDIKFSNNDQNIPVNYDIYVKWIAGYGSLSNTFQNSTLRRYKRKGLNLGYTYTSTKNLILADLSFLKKEQITYRSKEVEDEDDHSNYFATFKPSSIEFKLTAVHKITPLKSLKVEVLAKNTTGNNFWFSKGGKSYALNKNSALFNLGYIRQNNTQTLFDVGTKISYSNVSQKDALAATQSNLHNVNLAFYGLKSFQLNEHIALAPFAEIGLKYNLSSEFINGNQIYLQNIAENDYAGLALKDYYNDVIYPDVEMLSSDLLDLTVGVNLKLASTNKFNTLLHIKAGNLWALNDLKYFSNTAPNRFQTSMGLTVYY
ncbi:hypothetical protein L1I30_11815 [Gillisia sp. M10.2A]|uniref:DUF6850 domain-containing protein n=1 Tax=Gillisia lutea TaxID=2909668 RepID=A0ABS9EHL5_9FLAO|nr:DUF6850 family outer membrane beta-barrel protein [Gillisia lutea]MCF4102355.1 hypothetical protein [Gillisia lutea]